MEDNIIKTITPYICPHCNKDFFVEFQAIAPVLTGILTPRDIEIAKESVIEKIPGNKSAIEWVRNENTIFGPSDVDTIVENINKQYEKQN